VPEIKGAPGFYSIERLIVIEYLINKGMNRIISKNDWSSYNQVKPESFPFLD